MAEYPNSVFYKWQDRIQDFIVATHTRINSKGEEKISYLIGGLRVKAPIIVEDGTMNRKLALEMIEQGVRVVSDEEMGAIFLALVVKENAHKD